MFAGTLNASSECIAVEAAIAAAVTQFGDPNCYFIPANSDPAGPWFTGTGYEGALTGTGNCDNMIYTDGIHPIAYGHLYLGHRETVGLKNLFNEFDA